MPFNCIRTEQKHLEKHAQVTSQKVGRVLMDRNLR